MRIKVFFLLAIILASCNIPPTTVEGSTVPMEPSTPVIYTSPTTTLGMSSVVLPTPTSFPALSASLADEKFKQWLSGTSNCIFPCWGDVVPGETAWVDVIYQLKPVLQNAGIPYKAECRFGECSIWDWHFNLQNEKSYTGVFFEKSERLYSISISGDYDASVSLNNIFEIYGEPDQIFIEAKADSAGDPPVLFISILYARQKFMIRYMWWANTEKDSFVACDQPVSFHLGIVAIDESQWTATELVQIGMQYKSSGTNIFGGKPIVEISDMTIQDFFEDFSESLPTTCITIPSEYWQ
jgi:hypothetical protein